MCGLVRRLNKTATDTCAIVDVQKLEPFDGRKAVTSRSTSCITSSKNKNQQGCLTVSATAMNDGPLNTLSKLSLPKLEYAICTLLQWQYVLLNGKDGQLSKMLMLF
jgi:hypothetical protein